MPRLLAIVLLGLSLNVAQADTALFSPQGFRITQYRSPTPASADGAQTVDTEALQRLLRQTPAPVLIDVYRRPWVQGRFIDTEPHAGAEGGDHLLLFLPGKSAQDFHLAVLNDVEIRRRLALPDDEVARRHRRRCLFPVVGALDGQPVHARERRRRARPPGAGSTRRCGSAGRR